MVRQRPAKPCTRVRFPSPPPRFVSPARLAQRESASLTRKRSLVQSQYRAPQFVQVRVGLWAPLVTGHATKPPKYPRDPGDVRPTVGPTTCGYVVRGRRIVSLTTAMMCWPAMHFRRAIDTRTGAQCSCSVGTANCQAATSGLTDSKSYPFGNGQSVYRLSIG